MSIKSNAMHLSSLLFPCLILRFARNSYSYSKDINEDPEEIFELFEKENYCGVICEHVSVYRRAINMHIACAMRHCRSSFSCNETRMDNTIRRQLLFFMNDLRNKAAIGELNQIATETTIKASRMSALSYDMELEYVSRCLNLRCETVGRLLSVQDYCMNTKHHITTRPMFFAIKRTDNSTTPTNVSDIFDDMFRLMKENENYTFTLETIKNYYLHNYTAIGFNALHLLHDRADAFGCSYGFSHQTKQDTIYCVISIRAFNNYSGLFQIGEPCSKCPSFAPCNPKVQTRFNRTFSGLCGTFEFITRHPNADGHLSFSVPLKLIIFLFMIISFLQIM